ncbi:MAG TPA: GNAT family N-acetyltransferase [Solirubrobacteraceae bacterium]|jgi:ribosomal protein S18 acetylase RimI-like enzyme|nr:GNAT family N-acetyltransferase [Solirubrobacteraceae bacterium]
MSDFVVRALAPEATREMRQEILRPHQSVEELAEHEPPNALAVGAFEGEELVAVGLIGPDGEGGAWRIRGMATTPAVRGRGAGSAVLEALVEHAAASGAQRVWCNARTPARSLYERAGLRVVSEQFELPAIGPHYVMELVL